MPGAAISLRVRCVRAYCNRCGHAEVHTPLSCRRNEMFITPASASARGQRLLHTAAHTHVPSGCGAHMWRLACVSTPTADKEYFAASLLIHSLVATEPAQAGSDAPTSEYFVEVSSMKILHARWDVRPKGPLGLRGEALERCR